MFRAASILALLLIPASALATECSLEMVQLGQGVTEIHFDRFDVKLEAKQRRVKMKLHQAFGTYTWGWASAADAPGRIDASLTRGGRTFRSQMIALPFKGGLNWALYDEINAGNSELGTAYVMNSGTVQCFEVTYQQWQAILSKVVGGRIGHSSTVSGTTPEEVYNALGL